MLEEVEALSPAEVCEGIEVRRSAVHGLGVFATQGIPRGRRIGLYTGRYYGPGEVDERQWDHALTYLFGLSDGAMIDGAEGGNATRHINHSCNPNCRALEIEGDDLTLVIMIEARRRIQAGEELTLDYSLDVGEHDPADFACRCGTPRCRGTLVAA